jgi:hypothetical protein
MDLISLEALLQNYNKRIRLKAQGECWVCVSHLPDGYGYMRAVFEGKQQALHRFVYRKIKGEITRDKVIMHSCDTPACCRPKHLLQGSQRENLQDCVNKGRNRHGVGHHAAKLQDRDVVRIFRSSKPHRALAARYRVAHVVIGKIKRRQTWKHITDRLA